MQPYRTDHHHHIMNLFRQPFGTGANVRIAIVDTGVSLAIGELVPRVEHAISVPLEGEAQYIRREKWKQRVWEKMDTHGHGTAIAGLITSKSNGIAKEACLIPVKFHILESPVNGGTRNSVPAKHVFRALSFLEKKTDIDVVLFGLGFLRGRHIENVHRLRYLINQLKKSGKIIVAPVGNKHPLVEEPDAILPAVFNVGLSVGACEEKKGALDLCSFSSFGPTLAKGYGDGFDTISFVPCVLAPGKDLWTFSLKSGASRFRSGTGFAAAIVSGLAALVIERMRAVALVPSPSPSPSAVERVICDSCTMLPLVERFKQGYGAVNAGNAYARI